MAKSPFSSAGGGNADTSPYSMRANGGGVKAPARDDKSNLGQIDGAVKRARGGKVSKAAVEKAEASSSPKVRAAAMKTERAKGWDK